MLGFGLRTIRTMDADGRLPKPVRIGSSERWPVAEIKEWLAAGAPRRDEWQARRAAKK